jgi:hypothetical protein
MTFYDFDEKDALAGQLLRASFSFFIEKWLVLLRKNPYITLA